MRQRALYIAVLSATGLLAQGVVGHSKAHAQQASALKVGAASVSITPERPIWMAGLGSRKKRSEGKYQDLYVKALAFRDARGQTAVVLGSDLIAVTPNWRGPVLEQVKQRFNLAPEQVLINCSHTHCGPVIDKLFYPEWDAAYTSDLIHKTVDVIGKALADLEESSVSVGRGRCALSVNRRRPLPDDPAHVDPGLLPNPQGLADHDVHVLKVQRNDGSVKAVMFLYACHPTTMGGYLFGGDYAGFAQTALEAEFPKATALFLQGCGGDLKTRNVGANGRFKDGPLEVVEGFGRELSQAVLTVLAGKLTPVSGWLSIREDSQELPVQPIPPRAELEARVRAGDWRADKAKEILKALDEKRELPRSHRHIVQVLTIGKTFTLVGLSGEDCVEYALKLKGEFGGDTWVAGYSNDVNAYIPSARMIPEGGYEVERWLGAGDIPTPFVPEVEALILDTAGALVRACRTASAATP